VVSRAIYCYIVQVSWEIYMKFELKKFLKIFRNNKNHLYLYIFLDSVGRELIYCIYNDVCYQHMGIFLIIHIIVCYDVKTPALNRFS